MVDRLPKRLCLHKPAAPKATGTISFSQQQGLELQEVSSFLGAIATSGDQQNELPDYMTYLGVELSAQSCSRRYVRMVNL